MKRLFHWFVITAVVMSVVAASAFVFRQAAARMLLDFQTVPDDRAPADLIFVMSGHPFERLPLAVELYNAGLADRIVCPVSTPDSSARAFRDIFGFLPDEEHVVREALDTIPELDYKIMTGTISTYDDLLLLKEELSHASDVRAVLIVSSPYHTRRIRGMLAMIFGADPDVSFRFAHASTDRFVSDLNDPDDLPIITIMELIKQMGYLLKY